MIVGDAAGVTQHGPLHEAQIIVHLGLPVGHGHGRAPLGALFGDVEKGADDGVEAPKLLVVQMGLGGGDIALAHARALPGGQVEPFELLANPRSMSLGSKSKARQCTIRV